MKMQMRFLQIGYLLIDNHVEKCVFLILVASATLLDFLFHIQY
jgi:hypothetical protein